MGSGASSTILPERVDETVCREVLGEYFSLNQFLSLADSDGFVSKDKLLAEILKSQENNKDESSFSRLERKGSSEKSFHSRISTASQRSVSVQFLINFCNNHNTWNTPVWLVVRDIIVVKTQSSQCRFTDLNAEFREGEIGKSNVFVSHAWGNPLGLLVTSLIECAKRNRKDHSKLRAWIDIFAVNQHTPLDDLTQVHQVMRHCRSFVLVSDPSGKPFSRMWCLFEMTTWLADVDKADINIFFGALSCLEDSLSFGVRDSVCGADVAHAMTDVVRYFFEPLDLSAVRSMIENIAMERSEVSVPSDRELLLHFVERSIQGGPSGANRLVADMLQRRSGEGGGAYAKSKPTSESEYLEDALVAPTKTPSSLSRVSSGRKGAKGGGRGGQGQGGHNSR